MTPKLCKNQCQNWREHTKWKLNNCMSRPQNSFRTCLLRQTIQVYIYNCKAKLCCMVCRPTLKQQSLAIQLLIDTCMVWRSRQDLSFFNVKHMFLIPDNIVSYSQDSKYDTFEIPCVYHLDRIIIWNSSWVYSGLHHC